MSRERAVDFAAEDLTSLERPRIILRQHVSTHFQTETDRRRVPLGHTLERGPVIGRGIGEHEVQIDRRRQARVADGDVGDARSRRAKPIDGFIETRAHVVVQQLEEITTRHRES